MNPTCTNYRFEFGILVVIRAQTSNCETNLGVPISYVDFVLVHWILRLMVDDLPAVTTSTSHVMNLPVHKHLKLSHPVDALILRYIN